MRDLKTKITKRFKFFLENKICGYKALKSKFIKVFAVFAVFCVMAGIIAIHELSVQGDVLNYRTWLQTDSAWSGKILGNSGDNMSKIGCAVTAVAKIAVHSGCTTETKFNPGILVDFLSANEGFSNEGDIYWGAVTKLIPELTYDGTIYFTGTTYAEKAAQLQKYLDIGYFAVISVSNYAHWVAVDYVKGGSIYIMDPASNLRTNCASYYSAAGVMNIKLFRGVYSAPQGGGEITTTPPATTAPPATTTPAPLKKTGYYTVNADQLNHRTGAGTSYSINGTIPQGTYLKVTAVSGNWGQTVYKGKIGWCSFDYLDEFLFITGDVNLDGKIDPSDIILMSNYLCEQAFLNVPQLIAADINGDDRANITDLLLLKRKFIRQISVSAKSIADEEILSSGAVFTGIQIEEIL